MHTYTRPLAIVTTLFFMWGFLTSLNDVRKGRFKTLMERVPVHVITTRAALLGAAAYGLDTLNPQRRAMTS